MGKNYSVGVIILLAGVVILLGKLGIVQFIGGFLWPVFVLVPGILLHMLYFGRVLPSGVLIPAGILTAYSVLFFYCNLFGWDSMAYLWPLFILGIAVGLYEFYFFDRYNPKGALVAAIVLAVISGVFFGFTLLFTAGVYLIAVGLIVAGIVMIYRRSSAW